MMNNIFENYKFDEDFETAYDEEEIEVVMEDETEEAATIVDDGEGNFKLNIPEDPKVVLERNKAEAEKKAKEEEEKKKANNKNKSKKDEEVKVKPVKAKSKTKDEQMEESFSKYKKLIVKVFGTKEYEFTDPDEIKMLKLNDILSMLIIEKDYEEFSNGVTWSLTPGKDKSVGYLVPTYKFHPKG